jgi:hypothetical protein
MSDLIETIATVLLLLVGMYAYVSVIIGAVWVASSRLVRNHWATELTLWASHQSSYFSERRVATTPRKIV